MNRDGVRQYLEDWYKKKLPEAVERELSLERIKNKTVSLIGPRRAGKTYYFFQLIKPIKDDSIYLDFEDASLVDIKNYEIFDVINLWIELTGKEPTYIFLDEVQRIEKWETMIRTLLDRTSYNIFVTGSSSKLLSKEIATQLRGRTVTHLLLPFSFLEFLKARGIEVSRILSQAEKAKIKSLLKEFLEFGGFPEVVIREEKERILKEYYQTILFKDFLERFKIRSFDLAKYIFSFVFQNFSKEISINKLIGFLASSKVKMGKNTVYNYIENLQDTLVVFFVKKYSRKAYLRESWPKKVYICDTGISKILRTAEDVGKLMENCVFLDLLRMTNKEPLTEIFYWKDYQQREVDFVLKEGLKIKQLIQVTYASSKDAIEKRELEDLIAASKELMCKKLVVITWDYKGEMVYENRKIIFIPLWEWLLRRH